MAGSLGTLTLDLIAKIGGFTGPLDKASRNAKKNNREIGKSFDNLAKVVGVAIGSIPAVVTGVVIASASAAKEIGNLAALAGLGSEEFQKLAAGARSVGVDQEKLSGIFKDTNDKIGDFINTGGGELKDFFANIAPKVGVTADQFKKLNSRDALALYVTSLEKANVSQAEMTFYMEAIANDSTALVPLLRNNAKGFQDLGSAADAAGVIMSDSTISSAKNFGFELDNLLGYVKSVQIALAAEFSPLLLQASKDLKQAAIDAGGVGPAIKKSAAQAVEAMAFIVDAGDSAGRVFRIISAEFDGLVASAAGSIIAGVYQTLSLLNKLPGVDLSSQLGELENNYTSQVAAATDATERMRSALETPLAGTAFLDYYKKANENAKELLATNNSLTKGTGSGVDPAKIAARAAAEKKSASEALSAAKKIDDAFKATEVDYKRQIQLIDETSGKQGKASEVAQLAFEVESGKLKGVSAERQKVLKDLAAELDSKIKIKKQNEQDLKLATLAANLKDSNTIVKQGFEMELAGAGSGEKLRGRLKEDLAIQQDYAQQRAEMYKQYKEAELQGDPDAKNTYDEETALLEKALAERMIIQHNHYSNQDKAQENWIDGVKDAWRNYVDAATNYTAMAADATSSVLDSAKSGLSTFLSDVASGAEDAGDALGDLISNFAKSTLQALSDMASQWLVYQAVQLLVGKTTQASAVPTLVANAQATAFQASLAAFASTAAIPIVGPAAAPAAAAAAAAATAPMVAGVASAALAGMAHDGIDAVPETGTWLLQKGERVTTAETSAKLDRTLDQLRQNSGGGGGGGVTFSPQVTVQAQPGMSDQDARRQGELITAGQEAEFRRFLQREMGQNGLLWRRT